MGSPLARRGLLLVLAGLGAARARAQDGRALYLQHCASCHGETGDGKGTATLDRPARSFKEGGFSHGNTTEAIVRTLTFGIPGTPMPAAPSGLTEAERNALAEYVLSLGPAREPLSGAESILRVEDRPVIVRGKLPPIAEGLPERPRGLLVGLPDGLSFEYRADDVRLLALRRGAFVDRADWRGRGGDALRPLGELAWISGTGDPGPTFLLADTGEPLAARLGSTSIAGGAPAIGYELGNGIASVGESVSAWPSVAGSGLRRHFRIRTGRALRFRAAQPGPALVASGLRWTVRRRAPGAFEAIAVSGLEAGEFLAPSAGSAEVTLRPGEREIDLVVVPVPAWNDDLEGRWRAEVAP